MNDDDGGILMSGEYQGADEEKEFMPVVFYSSFRERLLEQVTGALKTDQRRVTRTTNHWDFR